MSMKKEHVREKGLVSFVVTMIMTIVISLIVVGFTQVANRNRREALDRQLSTQAYYAAESGVNETRKTISDDIQNGVELTGQTVCTGAKYPAGTIGSGSGISAAYTCILVEPTVSTIETSASVNESIVVPINPSNQAGTETAAGRLEFVWAAANASNVNPSNCQSTAGSFEPTAASTCGYGLLRVDLLKYSSGLNSPAAFAGQTTTFFMQPLQSGSGSATISSFNAPKAVIVPASCSSSTGQCKATIVLTINAPASHYFARITTLYRDAPYLSIDGKSTASAEIWFKGVQANIDVTARAGDVLRRIKVRMPLHEHGAENLPLGGIQSRSAVCKRFTVYSGYFNSDCL